MFEIINGAGASIAQVTQEELYKLRKQGLLKTTDKIIDMNTGKRVN